MAFTEMLHIADPRELRQEYLSGRDDPVDPEGYDVALLQHRSSVIRELQRHVGGVDIPEEGTLGSGGIFIPIRGRIENLKLFLRDNRDFAGVSVKEVA